MQRGARLVAPRESGHSLMKTLFIMLLQANNLTLKPWLYDMLDQLLHVEAVKVMVALWTVWWAKRKAVHENEFQSPMSSFLFIQNFLMISKWQVNQVVGQLRGQLSLGVEL